MVLPSIERLKASGTGGLTLGGRLWAWAAAAVDLDYSTLVVNIYIILSKKYICSMICLTLGKWAEEPDA